MAIVGRPNVGKYTLLNHLIGHKVSITSRKAQTTRFRIRGIRTEPDAQFVFVDTPGYQTRYGNALNRAMNRSMLALLEEVDAILFVVAAPDFDAADEQVLRQLPTTRPVLLIVNKIDRTKQKSELLPYLERLFQMHPFVAAIPVSAQRGTQLQMICDALRPLLPETAALYGEDEITDRDERFLAAEFVREKLFRALGEELPYAATVVIDKFVVENAVRHIYATVIVDNANQKAIVIGKGGQKLKVVASGARLEMERLFGGKVFLEVWVKVQGGWADDARTIRTLGYDDR